jgi:hypothetical protein
MILNLGGTLMTMTMAPHHSEIHHLVDKLTPTEAEALYVLLKSTVGTRPTELEPAETMLADEPVRRFSFTGIMQAGPNYAEHSKQIIRDELGRPDAQ